MIVGTITIALADQWVRCPVCMTEWISTSQIMCGKCAKK